ncbi:MAG: alpha/beta fold hydrolase [Pseudomonadota bacterium]
MPDSAPKTANITTTAGDVEVDQWTGGSQAVLMVHGLGQDRTMWREAGDALAKDGLSIWAPDVPGTDARPGPSAQTIAGLVTAMRTDGYEDFSLVGAAEGASAIAAAVLRTLVGDVTRLVLMAPPEVEGPIGLVHPRILWITADEDEATIIAVQQRMMAPDAVELAVYTGDYKAAELFQSPHTASLIARLREALAPPP